MKTMPSDPDVPFMAAALAGGQAGRGERGGAGRRGDRPRREVVARGHNRPIRTDDPTAHAEIVAIRKAARKLGNYRLTGCELYVTVEPCAMCLGAILQARIRRLVYGAADPKAGAVESIVRFPIHKTNHRLEIRGGVLADECAAVLREFFREARRSKE